MLSSISYKAFTIFDCDCPKIPQNSKNFGACKNKVFVVEETLKTFGFGAQKTFLQAAFPTAAKIFNFRILRFSTAYGKLLS